MPRNPKNPRAKEATPAALRKLAALLIDYGTRLEGAAVSMEEKRIRSMSIMGRAMLSRGLESVDSYVDNCEKAVGKQDLKKSLKDI